MSKTSNSNDMPSQGIQITTDELKQINQIVDLFMKKASSDSPPKFFVLTGGVGAGKTTIRRRRYSKNHVNFDLGDILTEFKNIVDENDPKLTTFVSFASDLILHEAIKGKSNIVIEVIGDNEALLTPVIDGMIKLGYEISIDAVYADPAECYKRHLDAVKNDKDYLSSYFTQEATLSLFYKQLKLGEMPVITKS